MQYLGENIDGDKILWKGLTDPKYFIMEKELRLEVVLPYSDKGLT